MAPARGNRGLIVADSRRLTGPSLLLDRPGAILEVRLDDAVRDRAAAAWRAAARRLLDAVGWPNEVLATRTFAGGVSLALTAPVDALYAATEVNEAAWAAAAAALEGRAAPDVAATLEQLARTIAAERHPALLALHDAARAHHVSFLSGEELVSVGTGGGAAVWPISAVPAPGAVDWDRVHDVPIALVTGSNGKTTVVRMLAAILEEAGRAAGMTSTDGVIVRGRPIAEGDYSGPSGARLLLRSPDVEVAVLETARGGMLRRGLPVERADVAVVTNVADDHLGEFGIQDVDALAEVKLLVARVIGPGGAVVLNLDDPLLLRHARDVRPPIVWFSLDAARPELASHAAANGRAAICDDGQLVLTEGSTRTPVVGVDEVPAASGGAARHNVANALAALGAASVLGVRPEVVARALRRFGGTATDNAGRANLFELGGVRVIVDYAHNPHGMAALAEMVKGLPAGRRLVLLGQAGDRPDDAIRALAGAALALRPDRVLLKDMERYSRGRGPGEVPALMADELARLGVPAESVSRPGTELESVVEALAWARPGDLLVLTIHQDRPLVLELIERLRRRGWRAGEPVV